MSATPALGTGVMRHQAPSVGLFGLKRASSLQSESSETSGTSRSLENKHVLAPTSRRAKFIDGLHAVFSADARYTWKMRREKRGEKYAANSPAGDEQSETEKSEESTAGVESERKHSAEGASEQTSEHADVPQKTAVGPPSASMLYIRYDDTGEERYLPQYY